nr:hypothetical protein [Paenibacillus sp. LC231]
MFKYLLIILSAIYGMLGLLAGIVVICAYMGHQKSMGIQPAIFCALIGISDG